MNETINTSINYMFDTDQRFNNTLTNETLNNLPFVLLEEHFLGYNAITSCFATGTAISSGAVANVASENNRLGLVRIRDSTTANGGYRIGTGQTALPFFNGFNTTIIFKPEVATWVNNVSIWLGVNQATSATESTSGCYLRFFNREFPVVICRTSASAQTNVSVPINFTQEYYKLNIFRQDTNNVIFRIVNLSNSEVIFQNNISYNIPTTTTNEGVSVIATQSTTSAAANIIVLDYMNIWLNRNQTEVNI
jgi:hypothetical protein